MTAHDPRVTLTEAEREAIEDAIYAVLADRNDSIPVGEDAFAVANSAAMTDALAEIVAARLAPIRALTERWTVLANGTGDAAWAYAGIADDLRAALDAPASASQDHDGTKGQGEGERAGEGCSCVPDGWHVVNPVYMAKLKRLEAEHD